MGNTAYPRSARRPRSGDDGSATITIEQYRAAAEGRDLSVLRRTGTDMSCHVPMPESQACTPTKPCDGEFTCSRHRPSRRA